MSPHRILTRTLTLTAAAAALPLTALVAPASASHAEQWEPVTQPAFTAPAGKYCTFGFSYQPDQQDLEMQVVKRYHDGAVKVVRYRGLLIGTTTNLDTGARITRDSSGDLREVLRRDGSLKVFGSHGPVGLGFTATDDYPQGYYQLDGFHRVRIAPDGTKTMVVDRGAEENICDTLG
ncbi:hypothetical protein BH11ACT8_BH11ACT8_26900 [soil metagenome]